MHILYKGYVKRGDDSIDDFCESLCLTRSKKPSYETIKQKF